jgi:hypothetical protein
MWYKFAALKGSDVSEQRFFEQFINVSSGNNTEQFWIVNGQKFSPPEKYGHNYTATQLKLQNSIFPDTDLWDDTPIKFVGEGIGSLAKNGVIRVSFLGTKANISIYGNANPESLKEITLFINPDKIDKWEIVNKGLSGTGYDSLDKTLNNLSLGVNSAPKEQINESPIKRVDNSPSFYGGREGD